MKRFKKKILKLGITLFTINQLFFPIFGPIVGSVYTPTIKANKEKIQEYKNIPKNFVALDYVNLANMIMNNYSAGSGECKDHSKETFNVYKQLIKQNNRTDLKKDIRLAVGSYDYNLKEGHDWIEINHEGKWITYESMRNTPKLEIGQIKNYSKESIDKKTDLIGDDSKIIKQMQTFNGTSIFYPKPASIINMGLAELFYERIKRKN